MNIYVGNLSWNTSESDLETHFGAHGSVSEAKIITDRETGRSRGFGFIEMDDAAASDAIEGADGKDFGGRSLRVSHARERSGGGGPRRERR